MVKEMVVSMDDLRSLSVKCGDCSTVITLDLQGGEFDVKHCPACHKPFDDALVGHVSMLAQIYKQRRAAKHTISFRVESL
jgi:uncharacterized CHY-type Zn-finger protein